MIYPFVLFYLGQLNHFPSCFGTGVTNLNEPLVSFPPITAGKELALSLLSATVNKKQ